MNSPIRTLTELEHLMPGDSLMARLIRSKDWSKTPIGPIESWSPALRMVVRLLLANRFPMVLWWGPQFIQIYNDPYQPIIGSKHPRSLGQPACECWREIWHIIGPLVESPFGGGPATWMEDIPLEFDRSGFIEETHYTIAYSPVPDDTVPSGIGGVLATVHEITGKVVGERRVVVLRDLGARSAEARTADEACELAAQTLAAHAKDIPFALLYLVEADRKQARLAGAAGVAPGVFASPSVLPLDGENAERSLWPLAAAMQSEGMETVAYLNHRLGGQAPSGPWKDPPHTAVVVPIRSVKAHHLAGFLVAGVSSRLHFDDSYRDFFNLVSSQIANAVASAREHEEEKKRAEALAELDRAKTAFFSNVSHEFRTPLTLMLGPLEDALRQSQDGNCQSLEIAHRNGLRLLKLVNTLLDFSRIEAGRTEAVYEPVDLATLTADLASNFRSTIETAGMRLVVDCPPLCDPVYVDRDMWEKIVLNLLSNAFKFTFQGEIAVSLAAQGGSVQLAVRDTGVGIPEGELPRLFERFYRAKGVRGRSYEGSGIGLALIQELVRLHGGDIHVESRLGQGTTFSVLIPLGSAHLPTERIGVGHSSASTRLGASSYVEEALKWLPGSAATSREPEAAGTEAIIDAGASYAAEMAGARILVADDNADMRDYVTRLLGRHYQVTAVADGQAALDAIKEDRPELVLSDVMMPRVDGFELLQRLRDDPDTRSIPVLLLSARAGEESRVVGLQAGADDYLVKPFSARELLARVESHLKLSRLRQQLKDSESIYRQLLQAANIVIIRMEQDGAVTFFNEYAQKLFGYSSEEIVGRNVKVLLPPTESGSGRNLEEMVDSILKNPDGFVHNVNENVRKDGSRIWISWRNTAIRNARGQVIGNLAIGQDVTERKQAEEALQHAKTAAEAANVAKSQFLANMSHELRTPMNAILGMTDLALSEQLPQMARDYLQTSKESAELLLELLNEILDFSRIEAGQFELETTPFGLRAAVEQIAKTLGVRAYEKGLELIWVAPDELPELLVGDPLRLRQVLMNLVSNAIKFTSNGEIVIEIALDKQTPEAVSLRFSVSDTGIGIAPEKLDKIFSLFTQADASITRKFGGTGLGLAISQRLVNLMGGQIQVKSQPEKGSTFHFEIELPVAAGQSAAVPPDRRVFQGVPVLVIAENATSRRVLLDSLACWGMQADEAPDVPTGLARLRQAEAEGPAYRLVLADAVLPGVDGFSLARWLQRDGSPSCSVILMLSATDRSRFPEQCKVLKVSCVEKPISKLALLNTIAKTLGVHSGVEVRDKWGRASEPPHRLLRILLAEDTPANQMLMQHVLGRRGHTLVVANNGREALQLIRERDFDVVLMDVQMPEMDGFIATAEVRKLMNPRKARLPIIAMTAHALKGDREKCLAAGMDAYISKPIDGREMIELVERLAEEKEDEQENKYEKEDENDERFVPGGQAGEGKSQVLAKSEAPTAILASPVEVFNIDEAMRACYDSDEAFQKMADCFLGECDVLLADMRAAIDAGDATVLAAKAHQLKGSVVYLGAAPATEATKRVEELGRSGDLNHAAEAFRDLSHAIAPLKEAIVTHLRS